LLQQIRQIVKNEELSKEIFADTLHAVWTNRSEVAAHPNPVGWMALTARNKAINMIRDEKVKATISLDLFPELETADRIEAEIEAKELQRSIELAVEKLAPREKLVFTLSRKHGLNNKEIAERLTVSENTVRNQLYNALIRIRKHVAKLLRSIFA
jgi:RNA polymerase sigma factor (sigma-70 family)